MIVIVVEEVFVVIVVVVSVLVVIIVLVVATTGSRRRYSSTKGLLSVLLSTSTSDSYSIFLVETRVTDVVASRRKNVDVVMAWTRTSKSASSRVW